MGWHQSGVTRRIRVIGVNFGEFLSQEKERRFSFWSNLAVRVCGEFDSLRTAKAFPVVASLLPKNSGGREATTGSASAVRRLGIRVRVNRVK